MDHKYVNDTKTLLQINVLTQIFLVQNHLWQQKSQETSWNWQLICKPVVTDEILSPYWHLPIALLFSCDPINM